jgi:hypothetical protein
MTREEAKATLKVVFGSSDIHKDNWVDAFVALGMLKLDDSTRMPDRERCEVVQTFCSKSGLSWTDCHNIVDWITAAGYKITK